jgi:hypothetical protein
MRSLVITETAVDLAAQAAPFLPNYTAVAANFSAEEVTLEGSVDEAFTIPVTLATLAVAGTAGAIQEVVLEYQYIRAGTYDATGVVHLLGN